MIEIPLCAALMRIKGGGHGKIREFLTDKAFDIGFPVGVFAHRVLDGKPLSAIGFGLVCLLVGCHPLIAALGAIGWLVGVAPSVGEEIGAIGGIKGNWRPEGKVWGWKRGVIRGVFLGACIALPLGNILMIPMGALFPVAYYLGTSIKQIITKEINPDWHIGEWICGAFIGVGLCLG